MNNEIKHLLLKWKSLEEGSGIQKARSIARILWVVGFILFIFVTIGVVYGLSSIVIAIAALLEGWVIAERNALHNRLAQWPVFCRYIDWTKVNEDLRADGKSAEQDAATSS